MEKVILLLFCLDNFRILGIIPMLLSGEHTTEYPRSTDYAWLMPRVAARLSCR